MDQIADIAVFARVVEAGSMTAAANQLRLTPSAVSKQIARLEDRLGAQLLHRTTRSLRPTEVGIAFHARCQRILTDLEEAEAAVTQSHDAPRGRLRINVPTVFGEMHITPAIPEFLAAYPQIQVDVSLTDRIVDILGEGYDVVVRIADLKDSSLIARRLVHNHRVVVGSPAYFENAPVPTLPDDLRKHNCLIYRDVGPLDEWRFETAEGPKIVKVSGNLSTNNAHALRQSALGGLGVGLLPMFLVGEDLKAGRLVPVLKDYVAADTVISAVYPPSRHLSPKVRAFVDFFVNRFSPTPPWDLPAASKEVSGSKQAATAPRVAV